MKKLKHLGLAAACSAILWAGGCGSEGGPAGGGGGDGTISTGQDGRAARLFMIGRFLMSQDTYNEVKAENASELTRIGLTFDDARRALVFDNKPLRAMYLRANGQILGITDQTGLVKMKPVPSGVTEIEVVNNVGETAVLKFNASQLGTLDNPSTIRIVQDANIENVVKAMDAGSANVRSKKQKGGRQSDDDPGPCGGNCGDRPGPSPDGCCKDYDGPSIDPATEKQCDLAGKIYHFVGSTCGKWYWEGVCREGMEIGGDEGVCYSRHKGRWCQFIDDNFFTANADKTKVVVGEQVRISIRNRTRKNEIRAELAQAIGQLTTANPMAGTSASGQTVTVAHYDGTSPNFTYVDTREITYVAQDSDLPAGQDRVNVTVKVYGQVTTKEITIEVCR